MTYQYRCSNGHEIDARYPILACPARVLGTPCQGSLRPVGKGSRTKVAQ